MISSKTRSATPQPDQAETPSLTLTGLRARGWTQSMVANLLGEPDRMAWNGHNRTMTVQLFALPRVESTEKTPEYEVALAKAKKRVASARIATETRRKSLMRDDQCDGDRG